MNILIGYLIMGISGTALGAAAVWLLLEHARPQASPVAPVPAASLPHHQAPQAPADLPSLPLPSEELEEEAERRYRAAMARAVERFDHDLEGSSKAINDTIQRMSAVIVGEELEKYREDLEKLRHDVMASMGTVQEAAAGERQKLRESMLAEVEAEKARLIALFDTRLGEVVNSFLLETLRHNVDLGAQRGYLMAKLEEHKEELKAEVKSS